MWKVSGCGARGQPLSPVASGLWPATPTLFSIWEAAEWGYLEIWAGTDWLLQQQIFPCYLGAAQVPERIKFWWENLPRSGEVLGVCHTSHFYSPVFLHIVGGAKNMPHFLIIFQHCFQKHFTTERRKNKWHSDRAVIGSLSSSCKWKQAFQFKVVQYVHVTSFTGKDCIISVLFCVFKKLY